MELWEYDYGIDGARGKLSELLREKDGLEEFLAEVASAAASAESQASARAASASRLGSVRDARSAAGASEAISSAIGGYPSPSESIQLIRVDVLYAIADVEQEIARQRALISSLEMGRAQRAAEILAEEDAARARGPAAL